jgi:hypothetical protein
MSIKQNGGVFGRNPTFNDVTIDGELEVTGEILANGGIALGDNDKVTFGADDDLQISHNGSASLISDTGTGDLYIRSSTALRLQSAANENYLVAVADGAVTIYHDNNPKIETKSTGIEVTGNISLDSGSGIDFSATAGTGTSELLDDYEEGVWTPTYAITGGSFSSITYNAYTGGVYTKVGNVVYVSGYITTNSASVSVDGGLTIEGLPFATGSGTGLSTRSTLTIGEVVAFGTNYPTSGRFQAGTSRIYLTERSSANGASTMFQASNMANTTVDNQIAFSGFYMI